MLVHLLKTYIYLFIKQTIETLFSSYDQKNRFRLILKFEQSFFVENLKFPSIEWKDNNNMASEEIYRHKKYDYESYSGPPTAKISILQYNPEYQRYKKSATEPKPKRIRKSALKRTVPALDRAVLPGKDILRNRRNTRF